MLSVKTMDRASLASVLLATLDPDTVPVCKWLYYTPKMTFLLQDVHEHFYQLSASTLALRTLVVPTLIVL